MIVDVQNVANISISTSSSHATESPNVPPSLSESQPIPVDQLAQLIAALTAQAQAQAALTQAIDYLIGQNQQLIELVIQQQEIESESPAPGDSLD